MNGIVKIDVMDSCFLNSFSFACLSYSIWVLFGLKTWVNKVNNFEYEIKNAMNSIFVNFSNMFY